MKSRIPVRNDLDKTNGTRIWTVLVGTGFVKNQADAQMFDSETFASWGLIAFLLPGVGLRRNGRALAGGRVEISLSQPQRFRRHFHVLIDS